MWIQILILAGTLGLWYFLAGSRAQGSTDGAGKSTMAGSFPGQNNTPKGGADENKSRTKKRKKNNKTNAPRAGAESTSVAVASPEQLPLTSEPDNKETADVPDGGISDSSSDEDRAEKDSRQSDEWATVGQQHATVTKKKQSNPIPVHRSAWEQLASDEDLDAETDNKPVGARVLRIGAAARPPSPPRPIRQRPVPPPPLTKKQRQNQRKAERVREQRTQMAELQAARLQQHQYEQFEARSREQWTKAQRAAAKKPWTKASKGIPKAAVEQIEGKLIWD
ncbi:hypothetical protein FB645_006215 [Coemansia sp. IMI 203386]|nr:hypothetical protein FB645_006215 [Coemansia sp. IMI 203386]